MRTTRKALALVLALALCTALPACGRQSEEDDAQTAVSSQTEQVSADDAEDDADDDDDDDDDDDAPVDVKSVKVKGKDDPSSKDDTSSKSDKTAKSTTEAASTTTATTDKAAASTTTTGKSSSSSKTSSGGTPGNTSGGTSNSASGDTSTAAATEAPTEAPTEAAPAETEPMTDADPEVPAEENVVSGILDLSAGTYEGEGIAIEGSTWVVTGEGTYLVYGEMVGQIEVRTTAKVKLKLNGVTIQDPAGPAILVTDAKKLTLTLVEGTYNYLSDGGDGTLDGCICTNDTLEIKGAGALDVVGTVAHGISSDDDIIIKNGTIKVDAAKSALMANDDITVLGGELTAVGATNGIKSKGTLNISGGTVRAFGGPKDTKSALYAAGPFTLTGGYVYAVGCGATAPDPATSTQCAVNVRYTPSLAAGTSAAVVCDGMQFLSETPGTAYNTLFVSTPDMYEGMTVTAYAADAVCGETTLSGICTALEAAVG